MDQGTKNRFASGFRGEKPKDETEPPAADEAIVITPEGDAGNINAEGAADAGTAGAGAGETGPGTGSEGGDDDTAGMPAMTHNEKTWQGRLAKREAELRAREAAIAAGGAPAEPAAPSVPDAEETGEPAAEAAVEPPTAEVVDEPAELPAGDIDLGTSSEILADAPDEIKAIGERWISDFGPEFISDLAKMTGYFAEAKAGAIASEAIGPLKAQADSLQGMLDSVIDSFQNMHRGDIEDNEPEFETVVNSPEFEQWVTSQAPEQQSRIVAVLEGGSAARIVRVLKDFKDWTAAQAEPAAGQVDTSALEAAAGVRSSGAAIPDVSGTGSAPADGFSRGFRRGASK